MSETTTAQQPIAEAPAQPQGHRGEDTTLSEYLESLLVTVLLALFATTFDGEHASRWRPFAG